MAGKPLLELRALRLDLEGRDSTEVLQISDIQTGLLHGNRIVLEGPAGRGKTTLTQLANAHAGAGGIPFLIDLAAWTSTRSGILQFIAGMRQFQARSLDAATLARGAVSISEEKARLAVAAVGKILKDTGQIAGPDPGSVLATLCAHHVLERQDYPEVAFRFEHQQFQEFYAAIGIGRLTKSYVNEPASAEPLGLLADDIRGRAGAVDGARVIQAGSIALPVPPCSC